VPVEDGRAALSKGAYALSEVRRAQRFVTGLLQTLLGVDAESRTTAA